MVSLDTTKLLIPFAAMRGFNARLFNERGEKDALSGKETIRKRLHPQAIRENCGLNAVEISEQQEQLTLEVSAKLLHETYPFGITAETVERMVPAIRKTGILDLDEAAFLETAEVLRCDASVNLRVENVQDSLRHLRLLGVNDRYHSQSFNGTGIVFTREAKSVQERMVFYDKFREMNRGGNARWVASGHLDAEPFRGILRAEVNYKRFRDMRDAFGVHEPRKLLDILSSDRQPVLEAFERIVSHPSVEAAAVGFAELLEVRGGYAKVRNHIGDIGVFERCGWDWRLIKAFILMSYSGGSKPAAMVRKVKRTFDEEMRSRRIGATAGGFDRVAEIHALLRQAA